MMGPIIANIGNILYVIMAIVGGIFIITEIPNLCLSRDPSMAVLNISIAVPFLNMTKQFTGNVNQVSQQINHIATGLAGAERLFSLMDEEDPAYQRIALDALEKGEVHFVTPQYTQENIERINNLSAKGIRSTYTDQLGYGYIGINAGKVVYENGTASFSGAMTVKYAARLHIVADDADGSAIIAQALFQPTAVQPKSAFGLCELFQVAFLRA